jgi:hypothetical protein
MKKIKIKEITICLHCGCSKEVVDAQIDALKHLGIKYKLYWNNRIDRHPEMYESYSELINHSVVTSPTEWVILINDRTHPTIDEVEKMISLLENGYACVLLYNVGFMGFSKELIRKIGWWDQRFTYGGWEDRDWVWRLFTNDLAIYESQEATYDMSWKSPLNVPGSIYSTPHWDAKYDQSNSDVIYKNIPEENYEKWDKKIGECKPEISESWKNWKDSTLNILYDPRYRVGSGESASQMLRCRKIIKNY